MKPTPLFGRNSGKRSCTLPAPHVRRRSWADARRDRVLGRLGYRVLRIEAEIVRRAPQEALARIRAALRA